MEASFDLTAKVRKVVAVVDLYANGKKVGETEVEVDVKPKRNFGVEPISVLSPVASAAAEALAEVFKTKPNRQTA
ncbi:hypothetical protein [Mycolicibacterium austroafricanum]|uniref:hypothetical protein n=1 Tax=Mycolicibacterium austroafricanum TaxID=39687 RepID=UPI001CA34275|nr:hypothetical protein [Mycolicibacterium austroafricanum]QZT61255.1 hypothetical protein JN085_20015 [Mycolicibacterium austroafricanum]